MKTIHFKRTFYPTLWLFMGALLLFSSACDSNEGDATRLRVLLTDAPLDSVLEANVTIQRIELIDSAGQTIVLSEEEQPFDLLKLRDGVTENIADLTLENGIYQEMRVVVGEDASLLFTDSSTMDLKIPSGSSSGIKIKNLPEVVLADSVEEVVITIDWDAEESFVEAGNSGMYIFKPVIKPFAMSIDGVAQEIPEDSTSTDG